MGGFGISEIGCQEVCGDVVIEDCIEIANSEEFAMNTQRHQVPEYPSYKKTFAWVLATPRQGLPIS